MAKGVLWGPPQETLWEKLRGKFAFPNGSANGHSIASVANGNGHVPDEFDRSRFLLLSQAVEIHGYRDIFVPASAIVSYKIDMEAVRAGLACPFQSAIIIGYNTDNGLVEVGSLSTGAKPRLWSQESRYLTPSQLLDMSGYWIYIPRAEAKKQLKSKKSL